MLEIKNDQLNLVLHAELGRSDVRKLIEDIIKREMGEVLKQTYNINQLCRSILVNEILKEKLTEIDQKIIDAVKKEAEHLCNSDEIKQSVRQKLNGYGSRFIDVAISEMQPYINGRVAEIVKDSDIKEVMNSVSDKISNRVFSALRGGEGD